MRYRIESERSIDGSAISYTLIPEEDAAPIVPISFTIFTQNAPANYNCSLHPLLLIIAHRRAGVSPSKALSEYYFPKKIYARSSYINRDFDYYRNQLLLDYPDIRHCLLNEYRRRTYGMRSLFAQPLL